MTEDGQEYGIFKPHLDQHTDLGKHAENVLEESGSEELSTKELAEDVAEKSGLNYSYIRPLLTEGREWIIENHDIKTEQRPEKSGGNPTIFWRLEK